MLPSIYRKSKFNGHKKSAIRGVFQITTKNAYTTLVTFNPEHTDFTDLNGKKTRAKSVQINGNVDITGETFNPAETEVLLVNGRKLHINGDELKVNNFHGVKKSNGNMTVAGILTANDVIIQSGKFKVRSIEALSDFSAGEAKIDSLIVTKNAAVSGVLSAKILRIPTRRPAKPTTGDIWLE